MEAIVLAGGLGTRLRSVVTDIPKAMVPVAGRPFLEYLFSYLSGQGVSKVVLSVGFLKEQIMAHFGESFGSISITYAVEDQPLGTGGGIRLAMEKTTGEKIFVVNGDTLFTVKLKEMLRQFNQQQARAMLALRYLPETGRYGSVLFDPGYQITGFREKLTTAKEGYINGGTYLIRKSYFLEQTLPGVFSIEKDFFEKKTSTREIFAFPTHDYFIDIGIPEDYDRAQKELESFIGQ